MRMGVIQCGIHYSSQQKIPKFCLKVSTGGFEDGTTVLW